MAGLHLITGNRLENLKQALAVRMGARPLPPLQQEVIVVQNEGMGKWLSLQLADAHGIFANVRYVFPKTLVRTVFAKTLNAGDKPFFSEEALTWSVMKVLPGLLDDRPFATLKHYLRKDTSGLNLFQLARQTAQMLVRYTLLRPDLILAWSRGENPLTAPEAQWQSILWRRILENYPPEAVDSDPAALKYRLIQSPVFLPGLPERISVFGISTLAPYYVDIIIRLSRQIDMDVYYMNPCRHYWAFAYSRKEMARFTESGIPEDAAYMDEGNRLLASLGTAGREFFSLLLDRVGDTGEDLFEDPGSDNMLTLVQSDVLNLVDSDTEEPRPVSPEDISIQVHACHSPVREVEVLYDTLLAVMEKNADVQPRDIVVMTPDISAYAPLIQAVFDTPESPAVKIAYSIADAAVRQVNSVVEALLAILNMNRNRYRAADVLDLLETPAVRNRFDLGEHDLDRIKEWIKAAGIRWGIDGQYRAGLELPDFHENTWTFGLDRMLLGHALPPATDNTMFAGILPWGRFDEESSRILGKLAAFARMLFDRCRSLKRPRPVREWMADLNDILRDFFLADNAAVESDIQEIRGLLLESGSPAAWDVAGFREPVSLAVVRDYLETRLAGSPRTTGFISNGVTFCTLLPMRSIPFKVVCMLGMNDGAFPRPGRRPGFDLLEKQRRPCDFSKLFEDRYLFLESLLSARKSLIISYVGQDIRQNTQLPPASVVSELLEYLEQRFVIKGGGDIIGRVVTLHPLQPFSPRYFRNSPGLFSYSPENCAAARRNLDESVIQKPLFVGPLPEPPEEMWHPLTLDLLKAFFRNPAAFIIKNRLNLNLAVNDDTRPEDREPFFLDARQAYQIRQELVETLVRGGEAKKSFEAMRASGRLPHGSLGDIAWTECEQAARRFMNKINPFLEGGGAEPERIECRLKDSRNTIVQGALESLYAGGQVFYRSARVKARDILNAWICHLALNAAGPAGIPRQTCLIGSDRIIEFSQMDEDSARLRLAELADLFFGGLTEPLCFFPEASYALAERIVAGKSQDAAKSAAVRKWRSDGWGAGEGSEAHISRCFDETALSSDAFQRVALIVYGPAFEQMKA